jgi:hypothetical protein
VKLDPDECGESFLEIAEALAALESSVERIAKQHPEIRAALLAAAHVVPANHSLSSRTRLAVIQEAEEVVIGPGAVAAPCLEYRQRNSRIF